mmetsp:Transcript_27154/g.68194  ORF Transcript_27154/g.68194 Transcript_27154/m.68194 type:complete len:272 (-) Transcript_27154:948-1763(-)
MVDSVSRTLSTGELATMDTLHRMWCSSTMGTRYFSTDVRHTSSVVCRDSRTMREEGCRRSRMSHTPCSTPAPTRMSVAACRSSTASEWMVAQHSATKVHMLVCPGAVLHGTRSAWQCTQPHSCRLWPTVRAAHDLALPPHPYGNRAGLYVMAMRMARNTQITNGLQLPALLSTGIMGICTACTLFTPTRCSRPAHTALRASALLSMAGTSARMSSSTSVMSRIISGRHMALSCCGSCGCRKGSGEELGSRPGRPARESGASLGARCALAGE